MNTELTAIDSAAKRFADARQTLTIHVNALNKEIEEIKRQYMRAIKMAVASSAQRHSELSAEIEKAPQLFDKPRTIVLHGIKVGLTKGKGKIDWDDDAQVVKLIKKHFPDQQEVLINTKETPVKKALAQLEVADLKKLGCTVEVTGDVVVIKPTDSDVDKIVSALLSESTDTTEIKDVATTPIPSVPSVSSVVKILIGLCSLCFLLFKSEAGEIELQRPTNGIATVIVRQKQSLPYTHFASLQASTNCITWFAPSPATRDGDTLIYKFTNAHAMYFRLRIEQINYNWSK